MPERGSDRALRRLWFVGLWLLLPWPMGILDQALVPAARYALLAAAALAVLVVEGPGGPVVAIVALFVGWAAATALGTWAVARATFWAMGRIAPRWRTALCLGALALGALAALWLAPYHTPFGRAPRGGLFEILS